MGSLLATRFSLVPQEVLQHNAHTEFILEGSKAPGLLSLHVY